MASSGKVKGSDVIEQGIFKDPIEQAKQFREEIVGLEAGLKSLQKLSKTKLVDLKGGTSTADIKAQTDALKESAKQRQLLEHLKKEKIKSDKQIKTLTDQQIKDNEILKIQEKQRIDLLKAQAVAESKVLGTEKQLLAQTNILRIARSKLVETDKDYALKLKSINDAIDINTAKIKANSDKQKQQALNVGNYAESVEEALQKTGFFSSAIASLTGFLETYEGAVSLLNATTKANIAATEANTAVTATNTAAVEASAAITEANVVATEASVLAHEANTVATQAETAATEKLTLAKRVLNAVTSPLGLILLAVAAVVALAAAARDVNQSLQDLEAIGIAKVKDAFTSGNFFEKAVRDSIALRKEINNLNYDLLVLKDIEGDLTEISNDSTIAEGKRTKAYRESATTRVTIAEKELDIAKRRLSIAETERKAQESNPLVGVGNALQEFYDKESEAKKAAFEAEDALGDLVRTNAAQERKIIQDKTEFEIELTRSKKLSAASQTEILTKQIADEKDSLINRRNLIVQLNKEERKIQADQFRIFNAGIDKENVINAAAGEELKKRVNFQELVNTRDAVALGRKIALLKENNLTDAQATEVAKIVAAAQKQRIENNDLLADQLEKEIKLTQELAGIQLDIIEQNKQSELDIIKNKGDEKVALLNKINSEILDGENALNDDLVVLQEQAFNESMLLIRKEIAQRQALLDLDLVKQEKAINESSDLEDIKQAKILKVQSKYAIDTRKLEEEKAKRINEAVDSNDKIRDDISKRRIEILRQREIKATQEVVSNIQKATQALSDALDQRSQIQNENRDREIDKTNQAIEKQRDLAERGQANQLAFEEANLAKQQLAARDALKREAKIKEQIQLAQALLNAYNAELSQPNANPNTAAAKAVQDVLLFKGLAKGLVQFAADGNEDVQGPGTTKSDSIPFMLSKHEGVVKAEANMGNKGVVKSLNDGTFKDLYVPKYNIPKQSNTNDTAQNIANSIAFAQNSKAEKYLEEIAAKPVQIIDVNKLGELVETIVHKRGRKDIITHKPRRRL